MARTPATRMMPVMAAYYRDHFGGGGSETEPLGIVAGVTTQWAIGEDVEPEAWVVAGSATAYAVDDAASSGFGIVAGSTTTYAVDD